MIRLLGQLHCTVNEGQLCPPDQQQEHGVMGEGGSTRKEEGSGRGPPILHMQIGSIKACAVS